MEIFRIPRAVSCTDCERWPLADEHPTQILLAPSSPQTPTESGPSILDMPQELLEKVLKDLPVVAKMNLVVTCRHFACSISSAALSINVEDLKKLSRKKLQHAADCLEARIVYGWNHSLLYYESQMLRRAQLSNKLKKLWNTLDAT